MMTLGRQELLRGIPCSAHHYHLVTTFCNSQRFALHTYHLCKRTWHGGSCNTTDKLGDDVKTTSTLTMPVLFEPFRCRVLSHVCPYIFETEVVCIWKFIINLVSSP